MDTKAADTTGSPCVRELYDLFAPVRKSVESYAEQEINDAIDLALQAVRDEQARGSYGATTHWRDLVLAANPRFDEAQGLLKG